VSERPFGLQRYGYQWWLRHRARRRGEGVLAAAVGFGGQRILVVPAMDLVVVLTSGMYRNPKQGDIQFRDPAGPRAAGSKPEI